MAHVLFIDIERSYTPMQIRELATRIDAKTNPMRGGDAPILNEPGVKNVEPEPGARPLGVRFREVLAKHPKIKVRFEGSTDGLKDK
ncbi:hypothetical protein [uncultured Phenylobacterium sp.]|uniref:hypothetical protein n=1 Tax=uncultured Phenylobacterium sp. TaxID=349273 RepID=UPI0025D8A528|nr:hypothetical protein [uncultured Phenylobacterium sp.]